MALGLGVRPRTSHEERSHKTRERLTEAAIGCLVEHGYRGTTFVQVCRRAGLTRGAVHHHYRDLSDLLLDAMKRLNQGLTQRVGPVLRAIDDPGKRVGAGIELLWRQFTSREFKAVVEIWVAQSHDPVLSSRIRPEMERYSQAIVEGFARAFPELTQVGGGAPLTVRFAFLVLLGMGFVNATIDPRGPDGERADMLVLLKRVVQRELAAICDGSLAAVH
jgi:AcrR family transcriptional regulator